MTERIVQGAEDPADTAARKAAWPATLAALMATRDDAIAVLADKTGTVTRAEINALYAYLRTVLKP